MALVSRLDNNLYTKIPDEIIEKAGLKAGTDIIWFYDDKIKQIIIMEKPDNFAKSLRGLGKEIWKDNDANMYVQEERNSWQ
jgi:bifunctional DNA-binding transcriptional regulator/antitoxin component of YhaV-PrlF toxin-antitoxin module